MDRHHDRSSTTTATALPNDVTMHDVTMHIVNMHVGDVVNPSTLTPSTHQPVHTVNPQPAGAPTTPKSAMQ